MSLKRYLAIVGIASGALFWVVLFALSDEPLQIDELWIGPLIGLVMAGLAHQSAKKVPNDQRSSFWSYRASNRMLGFTWGIVFLTLLCFLTGVIS